MGKLRIAEPLLIFLSDADKYAGRTGKATGIRERARNKLFSLTELPS
jgi:hypothetical protein